MHVAMAGGGPSASHVRPCSTEVFRRQPWLLQENPGKRGMRFYEPSAGAAPWAPAQRAMPMGEIGRISKLSKLLELLRNART